MDKPKREEILWFVARIGCGGDCDGRICVARNGNVCLNGAGYVEERAAQGVKSEETAQAITWKCLYTLSVLSSSNYSVRYQIAPDSFVTHALVFDPHSLGDCGVLCLIHSVLDANEDELVQHIQLTVLKFGAYDEDCIWRIFDTILNVKDYAKGQPRLPKRSADTMMRKDSGLVEVPRMYCLVVVEPDYHKV